MTTVVKSYIKDAWVMGDGEGQGLINPSTGASLATVSAAGLDLAGAVAHARSVGSPALRAETYATRASWLGAIAKGIHEHRDELLNMEMLNGGNTRGDAKFDVDGASATFAHYATLGASMGDVRALALDDGVQVGQSPRLAGRHIMAPRHGVALLINAFNFPAWGLAEKAACAILAGMPVIGKPAASTCLCTEKLVAIMAEALPNGAVSLVNGSAHELPQHLAYGDVLAFTGSSRTASILRQAPNVLDSTIRLNVEADSLNVAILGGDVEPDSPTYDAFLKHLAREITQKAGQKCTAIRRIFVPKAMMAQVAEELSARLDDTVVGNPFESGVRMGPLNDADQQKSVRGGIERLLQHGVRITAEKRTYVGEGTEGGSFVEPTLVQANDAGAAVFHDLEVFGPVATLLESPEKLSALGDLVARGRGGLVCAVYSDDRKQAAALTLAVAPHHGRVVITSKKVADKALPPGMVLPSLLHGGPGRAGGGEELGDRLGMALYSQRTAVQGDRALLDQLVK